MIFHNACQNFILDTAFGRDKARWNDNSPFTIRGNRIDHMLDKTSVYGHTFLLFGRNRRHPCPKTEFVGGNIFPIVGEIKFEGRIGDNIVEFVQRSVFILVRRLGERIAFHDVLDAVNQIVENQIQT